MDKKRERWRLTKTHLAQGDEMLKQVGRVVVTLAHIESTLGWFFCFLSKPLDHDQSGEFFNSLQTFERRLELTNFTIEKEYSAEAKAKWKNIYANIGHHRKSRNHVAHRGMTYVWGMDDKFIGPTLQPRIFKRGKLLGISRAEVKKIADTLQEINMAVWNFAMQLSEPPRG